MKVERTKLAGIVVLEPDVYEDDRGYFLETWSEKRYAEAGVPERLVQDNLSMSRKGVLRGLHLQHPHGQGKLVQVLAGEVFDVAVDVRVGSPTYGQWLGTILSSTNKRQVYIPPGFAHGFCVLSDEALFAYKCTEFYRRESELGIIYCDPDIGIDWPVAQPVLSGKDAEFPRLAEVDPDRLPQMA